MAGSPSLCSRTPAAVPCAVDQLPGPSSVPASVPFHHVCTLALDVIKSRTQGTIQGTLGVHRASKSASCWRQHVMYFTARGPGHLGWVGGIVPGGPHQVPTPLQVDSSSQLQMEQEAGLAAMVSLTCAWPGGAWDCSPTWLSWGR
jgi:hypothetical protein